MREHLHVYITVNLRPLDLLIQVIDRTKYMQTSTIDHIVLLFRTFSISFYFNIDFLNTLPDTIRSLSYRYQHYLISSKCSFYNNVFRSF